MCTCAWWSRFAVALTLWSLAWWCLFCTQCDALWWSATNEDLSFSSFFVHITTHAIGFPCLLSMFPSSHNCSGHMFQLRCLFFVASVFAWRIYLSSRGKVLLAQIKVYICSVYVLLCFIYYVYLALRCVIYSKHLSRCLPVFWINQQTVESISKSFWRFCTRFTGSPCELLCCYMEQWRNFILIIPSYQAFKQ